MTKKTKPAGNKYQDDENIYWLQVLAFGAEVLRGNVKNKSRQAYTPTFVVLP
ncbi:MAG: hypothetical protein ACN4GR_13265 [Arenicellales bacterium]